MQRGQKTEGREDVQFGAVANLGFTCVHVTKFKGQ